MNKKVWQCKVCLLTLIFVGIGTFSQAQEEKAKETVETKKTSQAEESTTKETEKKEPSAENTEETEKPKDADNTGTNPINFTKDFRIYTNYSKLNTDGDSSQLTETIEYKHPILENLQFRMRMKYISADFDINDDGSKDIDESGLGDMDIRFLTVPYLNMKKKIAIAVGLEVFFDTADPDFLGENSTKLGPQVFAVFFEPPGGGSLVAPAYQHVFSVDGEDVNRSQFDIFYLYTFKEGPVNWLMINPQGFIDYEKDNDFAANIDFEAGKMITKNQSFYVRPGVGFGEDRGFDYDVEIGWKIVW